MIAKSISAALLTILGLTGCAMGSSNLSAEQLAARPTESDSSLWDDEDYRSIAAKSCLLYKTAFDSALGDAYLDWDTQSMQWMIVNLTSGALEGHPKWGPINEVVFALLANSISRSVGESGADIPSDAVVEQYDLCLELGVDINK
jgi:hypothetical protein